jgi:nitrite reductase/ring-hydroxylating ferredoxin subunit
MSDFQRTIRVSDLPPGTLKTVQLKGEDVTLANADGKFYGIGALCNHQFVSLDLGELQGTKVVCAGHGAEWDLTTGKAEFIEPLEDMPLYEVKVEDGHIFVRKAGAENQTHGDK